MLMISGGIESRDSSFSDCLGLNGKMLTGMEKSSMAYKSMVNDILHVHL